MADRRTFLRGLAALPLIGGSVTLIGNPTSVAVPTTDALQERYLAWLAHEHRAAVQEDAYRQAVKTWQPGPGRYDATAHDYGLRARGDARYMHWFPDAPDIEQMVISTSTSTRAAIVLSAVGCPLSDGGRS